MKASIVCIALGIFMAEANIVSNVPTITLGVRFVCDTSFINARQQKNHATPLTDYLEIFLCDTEYYLRELQCPRVKLVLTGIYNASETEESQFEMKDTELGTPRLDPTLTLGLFQEWVEKQQEFKNDDIVFLLTSILIDDHIARGIADKKGYSYFSGLCSLGVGLVYDSGAFFVGAGGAAQQIAHMLGSPWDITDVCPESNKTLMATLQGPSGLSECTKQGVTEKYRDILGKPMCPKSSSKHSSCSQSKLPAAYFAKENYCSTRHKRRGVPCPEGNEDYYVKDKTKCFIGCCEQNTNDSYGFRYGAPDGTPCDEGKICIAAVCSEVAMGESDYLHFRDTL